MSDQQPAAGWYPDPDDVTKQRYWDGSQWTEHRAAASAVNYEQAAQIRQKSRGTAFKVIGVLVVLGLIVWAGSAIMAQFRGGDDATATDAPSPAPVVEEVIPPSTFKAKITNTQVLNPATLTVFALVKNTSDVEGRASCFVYASDPSGAYEGYDRFNVRGWLEPGEKGFLRADVTVTNEGALWATDVSVECEDRDA